MTMESDPEKSQHRRKKSTAELGYDSDSEGGVIAGISDDSVSDSESEDERKSGPNQKAEDSDDDMFASEPETDANEKKSKPMRHKNKTLDIDQFEKDQGLEDYGTLRQGRNELDTRDSDNKDSDSDLNESEIEIEAFNLREEAESGKFDKNMNYVREKNSDSENEQDAWMLQINKTDIRKARDAAKLQNINKTHNKNDERTLGQILQALIPELEPAETPMEALARLRPPKLKSKQEEMIEQEKKRKALVFHITDCCELLLHEKHVWGVYDMSREELMRLHKSETGEVFPSRGTKRSAEEMEEPEVDDYGERVWEFRWIGDIEVNGPYSTYEMKYWQETYFSNNVEVRSAKGGDFVHISEMQFDE